MDELLERFRMLISVICFYFDAYRMPKTTFLLCLSLVRLSVIIIS